MQIMYEICCGLDINAKRVIAYLIRHGQKEVCTLGAMTYDLL